MSFVCCKCNLIADEIGGFKSGQPFCRQCGSVLCAWVGERRVLPAIKRVKQCSPKVRLTKKQKILLEKQIARFEIQKKEPELVKNEWNLFIKKYFSGGK